VEENRDVVLFNSQHMMSETCYAFSPAELVKCENAILMFLNWRGLVPTSSEILKLLLAVANPTEDFTSIIQKSNYFIFMSLMEYDMTCYRYSSVALASLMCVLDELGY
jgi:hypothetical protein